MISTTEYAQLSAHVYDKYRDYNKIPIPSGFTKLHWQDDDPQTGFSAGVYRSADGKQVVVSFTGTNARTVSGCLPDGLKHEPSDRQPA